ncbi:hypothetical protein AVEN_226346-1 [Araneus ventricosus]|uniref:Uncharacterized protein n=1 Tax=Araneus ventricosus TaxID=182803 RepID=A0A4Y2IMP7_ARAVE|nr:hypothetical protein AVEN_226346-1 [Araneus ventricosus]
MEPEFCSVRTTSSALFFPTKPDCTLRAAQHTTGSRNVNTSLNPSVVRSVLAQLSRRSSHYGIYVPSHFPYGSNFKFYSQILKHKPPRTSPRPALTSGSTMNDRPPRQHSQALRFLHYSPYYKRFMQQPLVLPGYDLSSEMDPKSHTTIIVPSGWREPA